MPCLITIFRCYGSGGIPNWEHVESFNQGEIPLNIQVDCPLWLSFMNHRWICTHACTHTHTLPPLCLGFTKTSSLIHLSWFQFHPPKSTVLLGRMSNVLLHSGILDRSSHPFRLVGKLLCVSPPPRSLTRWSGASEQCCGPSSICTHHPVDPKSSAVNISYLCQSLVYL